MNFVNFPNTMWYEKFNWNLYSCSTIKDAAIPVYSISFRYQLGHRAYFLPTHWFSYYYVCDLNSLSLSWRQQLDESFLGYHLACALIVLFLLLSAKLLLSLVAVAMQGIRSLLLPVSKRIFCKTALAKCAVAGMIGLMWLFTRDFVPAMLRPRAGYTWFYIIDTLLLVIVLMGLNKGTNIIMGSKFDYHVSLGILCVYQLVNWGRQWRER